MERTATPLHGANNKDADQNARPRRLVCAFAVHLEQNQVFSRGGPLFSCFFKAKTFIFFVAALSQIFNKKIKRFLLFRRLTNLRGVFRHFIFILDI